MNPMRWLRHYNPGVPHTLQPYPERTLLEELKAAAGERPDFPMLLF